jgi:hypothetical protein
MPCERTPISEHCQTQVIEKEERAMKARKSERMAIRLTRRERRTLERLAVARDVTASQLLRQVIKQFAATEVAAK